ncbi:MAG: rhomboid family intramembrane serine protease [Bacteroidetes bacterium]|nr:rhomboid family intramembrane serine protease [Bacteroidota bacterium]
MITYLLIALTVLISWLSLSNGDLFDRLKYNPYLVKHKKEFYRLLTHGFIHADYGHLFINMFVLWSFGTAVENIFSDYFSGLSIPLFIFMYLGAILISAIPALREHGNTPEYNAVGASGAVSAVLFSYILMRPVNMLGVMLVIPVPAFIFGILYLWYEAKMQSKRDGIAHDAHISGALFGVTITILYNPKFVINFFLQIGEKLQDILK